MIGVFSTFLLNTAEEKKMSDQTRKKNMIEQDNSFVFQAQTQKIWIGLYINTYAVTKTSNSNTPELWGSLYIDSIFVA